MVANKPLFTKELYAKDDFVPDACSAYIYGSNGEPRGDFAGELKSRFPQVEFVEVFREDKYSFECEVPNIQKVSLRNKVSVSGFLQGLSNPTVYIDITGLDHGTWGALTRCALEKKMVVRIVYLEPKSYSGTLEPKLGDLFDLSERIRGIDQLPMYPSFGDFDDDKSCFVPLLGFEGTRFAHMFETVQPEDRKTFPIIGVPGFRQEYPFSTYLGNANTLRRSDAFARVRFAKSNCPFSLYYRICDLAKEFQDHVLKIGLIGTKPHALGALLFAMRHGERTEIIYDHVIINRSRTLGTDKCLVYGVSEFMDL